MGAASASMIRMEVSPRERPQFSKVIGGGLLEGARYVRDNRVVLALLVFGLTPGLVIYPFVFGLIPVYAAEVFYVGPTGLGFLMSASGIGMLLGTALVASLGDVRAKGKLIIGGAALAVPGMAAFSQIPWFGGGLGILVLLSLTMPLIYTSVQAGIQSIVPDHLRGRIAGFTLLTWGALPVGSRWQGRSHRHLGYRCPPLSEQAC